MRITSIDPFIVHVPLPGEVADSMSRLSVWSFPGLTIATDEGIVGTGFTGTQGHGDRLIRDAIADGYAPLLLEKDPLHVRALMECLHYSMLHWVGRAGVTTMALAAIDIALWDIVAQAAGRPLWQILGGHKPDTMPAYNTDGGWLHLSDHELLDNVSRLAEGGWRAVKVKVGHADPHMDLRRARAVRRHLGDDVALMIDANHRWSRATALEWAPRFDDLGLRWLEEPLHPDDLPGHAHLATRIRTPIALGEHLYSRLAFRDAVDQHAVTYIQVDVTRVAGVSEWLDVAGLAASHGLPVVPHAGDMGQVHQHLVAATPAATEIEYIPWTRELFEDPITARDGRVLTPQRPGAGTAMRPDKFAEYRVG